MTLIKHMTLRGKIIVAGLLPALMMIPMMVFVAYAMNTLELSERWVRHTHEVIADARQIIKQTIDLETGQRGYLVTGDSVSLEPFDFAEKLIKKNLNALKLKVSDNPRQINLISKVEALNQRWVEDEVLPSFSLRQAINDNEATYQQLQAFESQHIGKQLVDQIREHINDFISHEKHLIVMREQQSSRVFARLYLLAITTSILSLIFTFVVIVWLDKTILNPVKSLLEATHKVADGDLAYVVETTGYDETTELAQSFNQMVESVGHANSRLEEKVDELALASKYKSEFLANMSHEIRTPMNGVIGMAQLLLRSDLTDDQRDKLKRLMRSGESLLVILSEILDYSKIEANRIELESIDVNIPLIVADVESYFGAVAHEQGVEFCVDLDDLQTSHLIGDPTRIRQIINNLCSNGVKFTQQGQVSVVCRSNLLPDDASKASLRIDVVDTGVGIASEKLTTIFDAFSQAEGSTNREFGGTGLGLTISKNLALLMGGDLLVDSKLGQGTTFTLTVVLPVSSTQGEGVDQDSINPDLIRPLKVMVVDDNAINVDLLRWMLEDWGHTVITAVDGQFCIDLLQQHPVDVIFMDYHMPNVNGKEATKIIRSLPSPLCDTVIIGCTADAFAESTQDLLAVGQNEVIQKPVIERELHRVLHTYFKK